MFPSLQDDTREELTLSKYVDQFKDPQVSFGVKQHCPKTIQKAVNNTIKLEFYLVKSASSKVMQVMQENPEEQAAVTVIQSTCTERSCGYYAKADEESRTVRDDITEEPCTKSITQ